MVSNKNCKIHSYNLGKFLMNPSDLEVMVIEGNIESIADYLITNYGLKEGFALDVAKQMVSRPDGC